MAIATLDFETTYSSDYSLRKMGTTDYILDPRFQTIMCAVKVDHAPTEVFIGHKAVARRLATIDWSRCAMLAHHTHFDGAILAWHYGITPALYLDTLSMARATTHAVLGSSSLAAVSTYLGLPPKGDEVVRAMGKRLEDFTPDELAAYAAYCARDNENCRAVFDRMRPFFCASELRLIDLTVRMYVEPQVALDTEILEQHLVDVRAEKAAIMQRVAHLDKSIFSSNQKFAALLEEHGVEVPMKLSPATGQETFALARGDYAFKELLEDDTLPLEVQALLAARVSSKSTLEETRTQRLINRSRQTWPGGRGKSWAPVPLRYFGAHTGRFSGADGENWQNFKRGSAIRSAIKAPPGYRIVHRDASQIEARMVAWLAGCTALTDAFAAGRDVYSEFASEVYERKITKADIRERFVGKTSVLQLNYQSGPLRFRHALFIGNGGISVRIDLEEAGRIVYKYRDKYPEIPDLWRDADAALHDMQCLAAPGLPSGVRLRLTRAYYHGTYQVKPLPVVQLGPEAIWLPNGMCIAYPGLRSEYNISGHPLNNNEMVYDGPRGQTKKIYGGKVVENVSQALSRIIVTDAAARVHALTGYHPFLTTHDSLDYVVPTEEAGWMDAELERQFAIRPSWASTLPLASEGGYGRTLAEAEGKTNT